MPNEFGVGRFRKFGTKSVAMATSLELSQKEQTLNEDLAYTYQS